MGAGLGKPTDRTVQRFQRGDLMERSQSRGGHTPDGATLQNYDNLAHFRLLDASGEAPPWAAGSWLGKAIRGR